MNINSTKGGFCEGGNSRIYAIVNYEKQMNINSTKHKEIETVCKFLDSLIME